MMTIQAINPATSEVLKTYEEMAPATVKDIVSKTHEAFLGCIALSGFITCLAELLANQPYIELRER